MLTSRIAAPLTAAPLWAGLLCAGVLCAGVFPARIVAAEASGCGASCRALARSAPAATVSGHRAECLYRVIRVKTRLNVRAQPGGQVLDKIYPGDRTWGPCTKVGAWRMIRGTENKLTGYAYGRYLKKLGRR